LCTLTIALTVGVAPSEAAPSLAWSTPSVFDSSRTPSAVSCSSESLCVAVDREGDALSTSDPTISEPTWNLAVVDPGEPLNAVSCAPGGSCVAVDARGYAFTNLEAGVSTWSSASIDDGRALTGVSCPTTSLCVAVDESGNVLSSGGPGSDRWTPAASIDPLHRLRAVSCSTQLLCVAVDDAGDVLSSTDPAGGGWHLQRIDPEELLAVSCFAASECVAVDGLGDALSSADPAAVAATWSLTPIDNERLTGVSCSPAGLCVAVDGHGEALASDDPTSAIPAWSTSSIDSTSITGVSCLSGGFCIAVDTAARSLAARVSAPVATTLAPAAVSSTSATLAGAVDPHDAALAACRFEYGSGVSDTQSVPVSYTQSVPCSVLPTANGGVQSVAAQVSGLSPNTTYHYRVFASSPAGATAGEDETFTTVASSQIALVYPHPSITGIPAPGQLLTCHPGTPTDAQAQLSYVWLRDMIPIPGSSTSTYTVKHQDSGHHLQCQLTASNGGGNATAKSAFVTIPAGGAPVSVGESTVGKAVFKAGKLSVPLVCSPHASAGCQIKLRLTAVETLSGRRIVAVAARSMPRANRSATALRHVTVTLASLRLHLAAGARRTLTATLSTTGRRLLSSVRHFTASLSISGTVIGAIESQLSRQLVSLGGSTRIASDHDTRIASDHEFHRH
jgi:hypothetical protein